MKNKTLIRLKLVSIVLVILHNGYLLYKDIQDPVFIQLLQNCVEVITK